MNCGFFECDMTHVKAEALMVIEEYKSELMKFLIQKFEKNLDEGKRVMGLLTKKLKNVPQNILQFIEYSDFLQSEEL